MSVFNEPHLVLGGSCKRSFTCPKSSLSKSVSTTADALQTTNRVEETELSRCSASATNSLPVPVSPVTSAARKWRDRPSEKLENTSSIWGLRPTIFSKLQVRANSSSRRRARWRWRASSMRA